MTIIEILKTTLSLFLAVQPILITLSGIFAVLSPLPYIGGPWATAASKGCAVLVGDLGGLVRWLGRLLAASEKQLQQKEEEAAVACVDEEKGIITLADPAAAKHFKQGTKIVIVSLLLSGCAGLIPAPTSPCSGLYCLEWDNGELGLPGSTLICEKTEVELQHTREAILAQHPKSTFKKVGTK